MTYETPEILDLGAVEELTFGGEIHPTLWDHNTGYTGFYPRPYNIEE